MADNKISKAAALLLAALVLAIYLCFDVDVARWGATPGASWMQRVAYSFLHASFIHAALNLWCFIAIVFRYDIHLSYVAVAFIIAAAVPDCALAATPTIGLSAVCYALLGVVSLRCRDKVFFFVCIAAYLALAAMLPQVNAAIHLYAFIAGMLWELFNMPLICHK